MGWWNARPDGSSLVGEDTGILWGDGPADVVDRALDEINKLFRDGLGRNPTDEELLAGLKFSLPGARLPDPTWTTPVIGLEVLTSAVLAQVEDVGHLRQAVVLLDALASVLGNMASEV